MNYITITISVLFLLNRHSIILGVNYCFGLKKKGFEIFLGLKKVWGFKYEVSKFFEFNRVLRFKKFSDFLGEKFRGLKDSS